jgi:NTE family protein
MDEPPQDDLAIVLGGGGARAAYQAGFLRGMARYLPDHRFRIVTGVSAGAINAAFLAAHPGPLGESGPELADAWLGMTTDQVFRVDLRSLLWSAARWVLRLGSGGAAVTRSVRSLMDTSPLDAFLRKTLAAEDGEVAGIGRNVDDGHLKAFACTTLNYGTGQTITWVQGCDIRSWDRPNRRSRETRIRVAHVMASAALPLVFPAVEIDGAWYGDGGIRLAAPLSPALHLGARRLLTISTRYGRTSGEADRESSRGYPPPAQVLGKLLNAIFLDVVDQDVERLQRMNAILAEVPAEKRGGLAPVDLLVVRPSADLGQLAGDYEVKLPRGFRFMTRGLGTRETSSPDFLSLLMFQGDYLDRLVAVGEADAAARKDEVLALVRRPM